MVDLQITDVGSGPPLLLLHAFPLSRALWRAQIAEFAATHRVIAPDLRGFGLTPPAAPAHGLDDYADDVPALLDRLQLPRVTLVGLSMGGYIAFALLRRAPERIERLILADTRAAADSDAVRAARAVNAELVLTQGSAALADKLLPGLVAPGTSPALLAELHAVAAANPPQGSADALLAMAVRPDNSDLLPTIAVPTTVIVGEHDTLTPPAEAQRMAAAIPNAQFIQIAGAGHLSAIEAPAAFNAALHAALG
jgi:3-oxoadipate enol-lactonase